MSPALIRHRAFLAGLCGVRRAEPFARRLVLVFRSWPAGMTSIAVALSFPRHIVRVTNRHGAAVGRGARALPAGVSTSTVHWRLSRPLSGLRAPAAAAPSLVLTVVRQSGLERKTGAEATSRADGRTAFPRLSTTLVRTMAAASAAARPFDPAHSRVGMAELRAAETMRSIPSTALPPDELSRVTEHVLRTLDRRVLSYRERMGQA